MGSAPSGLSSPFGYRFEGVVVDTQRRRLLVDGEEVACAPLVFSLLLVLCRSGGAVLRREQLLLELWPGEVAPAEESLAQVLHRLRAVLGTYSKSVLTVRGIGIRLTAAVEALREPP